MSEAYERLEEKSRKLTNLTEIIEDLHWDQEVMMPKKGVTARSQELSTISGLRHQLLVSEELADAIDSLEQEELEEGQEAVLREISREHRRAREVPQELVEKISETSSRCLDTWKEAREEDDFEKVAADLSELVDLKRRYANAIDPDEEPYRVLFKDYEPYIEFETMERILENLKEELVELVDEIRDSDPDIETGALKKNIESERQMEISRSVVDRMGYDWERGRFDTSAHPFTSGNQYDCRITTRFSEDNLAEGLMASIHECGHALYELGLPREKYGTPLGASRDLSVHESQSRLWENHVGRSRAFWSYLLPELKEKTEGFEDVTFRDCYESINQVKEGNLIRIEADELTYHLHIILRFELERRLVNGEIEVEELPELWNQKMEEYLGLTPDTDADGVMQDIHWYQGSIGYFPTYSLGSVLAAQIFRSAEEEVEGLDEKIEDGDFEPLLEWLRENVHRHGQFYRTEELVEKATGEKPTADYFLEYVKDKYGELYGL
ncbi:MAG: carboxypeptidase M32 [Candidatus Nanohaloarchaea archaeon]